MFKCNYKNEKLCLYGIYGKFQYISFIKVVLLTVGDYLMLR